MELPEDCTCNGFGFSRDGGGGPAHCPHHRVARSDHQRAKWRPPEDIGDSRVFTRSRKP